MTTENHFKSGVSIALFILAAFFTDHHDYFLGITLLGLGVALYWKAHQA